MPKTRNPAGGRTGQRVNSRGTSRKTHEPKERQKFVMCPGQNVVSYLNGLDNVPFKLAMEIADLADEVYWDEPDAERLRLQLKPMRRRLESALGEEGAEMALAAIKDYYGLPAE